MSRDNIVRTFYTEQALQELERELGIKIDRDSVREYNCVFDAKDFVRRLYANPKWKALVEESRDDRLRDKD